MYNGSGVWVRLYNWTNDSSNGVKIRADRMDAEFNDYALNGFGLCLTRDGQGQPTANLPMAGFKHTGVASGTARTHYASIGQLQDNAIMFAAAGGTADALTATFSPNTASLVDGEQHYVRAASANATTTPTYAPDGLTAHTITKFGGAALLAGDIQSGHELILRYRLSATRWELLNPRSGQQDVTSTGSPTFAALTTTGNVIAGGGVQVGNGQTVNLVGGGADTGFAVTAGAPFAKCAGTTIWSSDSGGGFYLTSTGTTASAANAFINNGSGNLVLRSTSSIRYKTDVQYLGGVSEIIDALKPMTYRSLAAADDPVKRHYGLLAEEVAKVEPALVQWTKAESVSASDDYFAANAVSGMVPDGVQYERLVVLLIAKVQSLDARLKTAGIA